MYLSGKFKVTGIRKKTSAVFFKDLQVGDEFTLVYTMNGYYHSAPAIVIYKDGVKVHMNNANQLNNNLSKFDIEQKG